MEMTEGTVVRAARSQVSTVLDGEAVLLELSRGVYFGLNEVGTVVWQLVQEPRTVASIRDAVCEEYDVTREQCLSDVSALLDRLRDEGLLEVVDAPV
jgi:hypothetical protein